MNNEQKEKGPTGEPVKRRMKGSEDGTGRTDSAALSINIFPMLDSVDINNLLFVVDLVENTIFARTNSVPFGFREFLYSDGSWIGRESSDSLGNSEDFFAGEKIEVLLSRRFKDYLTRLFR